MSSSEKSAEEDEDTVTESSSSESSSSDDEDDNGILGEDVHEKDFLKTLSCLKNKDPQIYDENVKFFNDIENKGNVKSKAVKSKPMYLRDYERTMVENEMSDKDEMKEFPVEPSASSYNDEQRMLKESFKEFLKEEDSSDEENGKLLMKKVKNEREKEKEDKDYIEWLKGRKETLDDKATENELKPLYHYWNNPELDKKEEFLKDYILNKRYLEVDVDGNYDDSDLSEDEKVLVDQEEFEENYNSRFNNEGENGVMKRYPRSIEGSLRRKNEKRKQKREEIQCRKKEEKEKKKIEIKKKQKDKLNEVMGRLEKLKELTGNEQLAFKDEEILEDFDPELYDKRMNEMYNENFYSENIDEKPDTENWTTDEINMDCEADTVVEGRKHKETRSKRKRKNKKSYTDICDIVKPSFDPEKYNTYQQYIDEYYNVDCEDFIDDIPCRFKYRTVVPNDYGLSVEEILLADDKELNQWVSSKKFTKLRPKHVEKNEVKIYRQKGSDVNLKMRLIPSLFSKEDDVEEGIEAEENNLSTEQAEPEQPPEEVIKDDSPGKPGKTSKKKKKKKLTTKPEEEQTSGTLHKINNKTKFKKKSNNKSKSKNILNTITDKRLLAYNIKPRQFKAKLKHKSSKKS